MFRLSAVTCASPTFCLAINHNAYFAFDGVRWSGDRATTGSGDLDQVSCADTTRCVAVGSLAHDVVFSY